MGEEPGAPLTGPETPSSRCHATGIPLDGHPRPVSLAELSSPIVPTIVRIIDHLTYA